MMNNTMLANEMAAHFEVARDLRVGDLAVFTDYKGRQIGCRVTRMWAAGEISNSAQIECQVVGLSAQGPYQIGFRLVVEASKVRGAV